jgi:acid phosphatase (class A)
MVNGEPICTPEDEEALRGNGSYPSGHAAIGWGWALILTELAPERGTELLARGRAFAESRMFCNVHWWSDVVEGQRMGAAAVARLHADPVFRAQLDQARGEVDALLASGEPPARDCAAEAAALGASGG